MTGMTLERRQLAKRVSMETGCSDDLTYRAVGALFDAVRDTLIKRGKKQAQVGVVRAPVQKGEARATHRLPNKVLQATAGCTGR